MTPGATNGSPLKLHGSAFTAGIWLYENDLIGMTSEGFYPSIETARITDDHERMAVEAINAASAVARSNGHAPIDAVTAASYALLAAAYAEIDRLKRT